MCCLGNEKVFRKVSTTYSNGNEDRKWKIEYCNINRRCRHLEGIEYKWDEQVPIGGGDHQVNQKIIDNLDMSYSLTSSIEISETNTKSVSESYSYGSSSSTEIGASLSISNTATVQVPGVPVCKLRYFL